MSIAIPLKVLIMERVSVPASIAALAGIVISVTFGVNLVLMKIREAVLALTALTSVDP